MIFRALFYSLADALETLGAGEAASRRGYALVALVNALASRGVLDR